MRYYIKKYDKKINEYEKKMYKNMKLIKKISESKYEAKYYLLLTNNTKKLDKYEEKIQKYREKRDYYISLFQDLSNN